MKSINLFLNKIQLVLLFLAGFLFPIFILPQTTDSFFLPKQVLILGITLLVLALSGLKLLTGEELRLRRTPYDIPLLGFVLVLIISTFFSVARIDSIIFTINFLSLVLLYYLLINLLKSENQTGLFMLSLMIGAAIASIILILSFSKIYFLSFLFSGAQAALIKNPAFNTFGNLLEAAIFSLIIIPLGLSFASLNWQSNSKKNTLLGGIFLVLTLIIAAGGFLTVYQLFTAQKPLILPFETGLQAATGSIGQNFQTLLFGSGPGTFLSDFTRFRSVAFNNSPLWNTLFFSSSSLFLEFLATTGLIGIALFIFLLLRTLNSLSFDKISPLKVNRLHLGLFLSLVFVIISFFIFPTGFAVLFLFFIALAVYTNLLSKTAPKRVFETKILVVNLQEGLGIPTNAFSLILAGLMIIVFGAGVYFGGKFLVADIIFQKSLVAASENKGTDTYELQKQALEIFPYRDSFYRVFSQTNLALGNSLSQNLRAKEASPSAKDQQTIFTLVQQSISNANTAVNLSPKNFLNLDNRATIYRNLIGFGQNAENFAITSLQQEIALNPVNPQLYLSLGGIYYQLGQWEEAQRQFEAAVRLKPDFANAYYNLGHALEQKGELQNALLQYQTAEALLARDVKDSDNYKKLANEIEALKVRITNEGTTVKATPPTPPTAPRQEQKVEIPPPTEATRSGK